MPQAATETSAGPDAERGSPTAHYAPGEDLPLRSYAIIAGAYSAGLAAALAGLRLRGRALPERFGVGDVLLLGIATHKISRLISKDKVTSFVRAPFTRYEESSGHGEVEEQPYGSGLRYAIGELLVCPYCIAQWVASGLAIGLVAMPRLTRLLSTVFAVHTVSDFLQIAYRAAEDRQ